MYFFGTGRAVAFSFSGTEGRGAKISYNPSLPGGNGYTPKLMVISECAGDLDYSNLSKDIYKFRCYVKGPSGSIFIQFHSASSSLIPGASNYCNLEPGKTYYATIRNSNAIFGPERAEEDSCSRGEACGATITTNRY
jgi:hypothetical protein